MGTRQLFSISWDDDTSHELRETSSLLLGTKTLFYQYFQDFFRPTLPWHRSSSPSRTCRHHGGRRGVTQWTLRHVAGPSSRPWSIMTMIPPVRAFQKSEQRKAWPQVRKLTWKAFRGAKVWGRSHCLGAIHWGPFYISLGYFYSNSFLIGDIYIIAWGWLGRVRIWLKILLKQSGGNGSRHKNDIFFVFSKQFTMLCTVPITKP